MLIIYITCGVKQYSERFHFDSTMAMRVQFSFTFYSNNTVQYLEKNAYHLYFASDLNVSVIYIRNFHAFDV